MHSPLYVKMMNSARWKRLRAEWLTEHPLCAECAKHGWTVAARCVHHMTPVESGRNDRECEALAFSRSNLQSLCYRCHSEVHKAEKSRTKDGHQSAAQARLEQWAERRRMIGSHEL